MPSAGVSEFPRQRATNNWGYKEPTRRRVKPEWTAKTKTLSGLSDGEAVVESFLFAKTSCLAGGLCAQARNSGYQSPFALRQSSRG